MSKKTQNPGQRKRKQRTTTRSAVNGKLKGICKGCGVKFKERRPNQEFCLPDCQRRWQNKASRIGQAVLKAGIESKVKTLCREGRRMGHHFAKIETSKRVRKLFNYLRDCRPHTTLEIQNQGIVGASSVCSELRANLIRTDLTRLYQGFRLPEAVRRKTVDGFVFVFQLERVVPREEGAVPKPTVAPSSPSGQGKLF